MVATHVNKVAREHLPVLFNYDDITQLHQRLESLSPRLAEDFAAAFNFSELLKVYRQLLIENVSLKDIVTIATTLLDSSNMTRDSLLLTSDVRYALRTGIVNSINGDDKNLWVYTINNELENMLLGSLTQAQQAGKVVLDNFPVDPNILTQLQQNMPIIKEQMKAENHQPILLVTPQLRPLISRYARLFCNGLNVLSYNEIPDDMSLNVVGTLE